MRNSFFSPARLVFGYQGTDKQWYDTAQAANQKGGGWTGAVNGNVQSYVNTWSPQSQYYQPKNPSLGSSNPNKSAAQLGIAPYDNARDANLAWRAAGGSDASKSNYSYKMPTGGVTSIAAEQAARTNKAQGGSTTTTSSYTNPTLTATTASQNPTSQTAQEFLQNSFKIKQGSDAQSLTLPQTQAEVDAHKAALDKFESARQLAEKKYADEKTFQEQRWQRLQDNFEQNRRSVQNSNAGILQQLRANANTRKGEIDQSTTDETTRQVQYLAGKNALMSSLGQGSLGRIRNEGEKLKSSVEVEYGNKVAEISRQENDAVTGLQRDLQQNLLTIEQSDFTSNAERDAAVQSAYSAALTELGTIKSSAATARKEAEKEAADLLFKEKELATNSTLKEQANAIDAAKANQSALTELAKFVHFETSRDGSVVGVRADGSAVNFGKIGKAQGSSSAAKPYEPTTYKDYVFELQNGLLPAGVKTFDEYRTYRTLGLAPGADISSLFRGAAGLPSSTPAPAATDSGGSWLDSITGLFK
jgi:hypothetical protein